MSNTSDIGVVGGDMRQVYMADFLVDFGYCVSVYGLCESTSTPCYHAKNLSELMCKCQVIIGPIPFSSDNNICSKNSCCNDLCVSNLIDHLKEDHLLMGGVLPPTIINHCTRHNIKYCDLMKISRLAILNTIATAEGTIMEAIKNSTINLHGANSLVLGFGKCAKTLAGKLYGLSSNVTIAVRSKEAIASAESYGYHAISLSELPKQLYTFQFIFNTIPTQILPPTLIDLISPTATIIDIASAPGGLDHEYARSKCLNSHLCLSLPGKVAPKTSAIYLVNEIVSLLNERSD